jgi:uncharacterized protein (TIGR02284 family)
MEISVTRDDTIDVLNDLIETCKNGEAGFRTSAEQVDDVALAGLLGECAQDCAAAARELQACVIELGGKAEDSGSAAGALHRGWVSVKSAVAGRTNLAVMEEVERGEDVALASYRKAMRSELPDAVQSVVSRQFDGVQRNHDRLRDIRNRLRATEGARG